MVNDLIHTLQLDQPGPAAGVAAAVTFLVMAFVMWIGRRGKVARPAGVVNRRPETILTIIVAVILTGASAQGMWMFWSEVVQVKGPLLVVLFGGLELALFAEALRARSNLLVSIAKHKHDTTVRVTTGVDGIAVWFLAGLTGFLSALHADSIGLAALRLVLPFVAAWLWERALASEKSDHGVRKLRAWVLSLENILIKLRLVQAKDRDVTEVERARRINKLADMALDVHHYPSRWEWLRKRRERKLMDAVRAAAEHLNLASDQEVMDEVQRAIAVRYGAIEGTRPQALAALDPWAVRQVETTPAPAPVPSVDELAAAAYNRVKDFYRPQVEATTGAVDRLTQRLEETTAALTKLQERQLPGLEAPELANEVITDAAVTAAVDAARDATREIVRRNSDQLQGWLAEEIRSIGEIVNTKIGEVHERIDQLGTGQAEPELKTATIDDVRQLVTAWLAKPGNDAATLTRYRIEQLTQEAGFKRNSRSAQAVLKELQEEPEMPVAAGAPARPAAPPQPNRGGPTDDLDVEAERLAEYATT